MNVYDFDGTIYDGDSTIDFYIFCLKKYPQIIFDLPNQIKGLVLYKIKKINKTEFKERFFSFLARVDNIDKIIVEFWNIHEKKIKKWYVKQHLDTDVVISASPEFLLNEVCKRQVILNLIASDVDKYTGKFETPNCYGVEKVRRFYLKYPNGKIDNFYSDSYSDAPLAQISQKSYKIVKHKIENWNIKTKEK